MGTEGDFIMGTANSLSQKGNGLVGEQRESDCDQTVVWREGGRIPNFM